MASAHFDAQAATGGRAAGAGATWGWAAGALPNPPPTTHLRP